MIVFTIIFTLYKIQFDKRVNVSSDPRQYIWTLDTERAINEQHLLNNFQGQAMKTSEANEY